MKLLTLRPAHEQEPLDCPPYDRWFTAQGDECAEFHRTANGYRVRFTGQADFEIDAATLAVSCTPVPEAGPLVAETLYNNTIQPFVGNFSGGLNLHGSAVCIGNRAVAFLGMSRRGKTTLAGAFARAGHPFLTEDVITLERADPDYMIQPNRPVLRLFHDSASFLLGGNPGWEEEHRKAQVSASECLPYRAENAPLGQIFILGPGKSDRVNVTPLGSSAALIGLLPNAFILDVEHKQRLKGHFERLGRLAETVPVYELDYPRTYDHLPRVIEAIVELAGNPQVQK